MPKLKPDDIILIRQLIAEKVRIRKQLSELTNEKIAEKFEVSRICIDRIESGKSWGSE